MSGTSGTSSMSGMSTRTGRPVALITGASRGIGAATARELARRGYAFSLAARSIDKLEELAAELNRKGCPTLVVPTDVQQNADLERLVELTLNHFGKIDVLINNAAIAHPLLPVAQLTGSDIDAFIATNLVSHITLTRLVLPTMLSRRRGTIVFVDSVGGHIGIPAAAMYSTSKFGMRGFAAALRREVQHTNIKVSVVSPGFIDTTFVTLPGLFFLAPVEQVARGITRVIARPRREIIVPNYYRLFILLDRVFPRSVDVALRLYVTKVLFRGRPFVVAPGVGPQVRHPTREPGSDL
jgi:short-subunit dehydrogenase